MDHRAEILPAISTLLLNFGECRFFFSLLNDFIYMEQWILFRQLLVALRSGTSKKGISYLKPDAAKQTQTLPIFAPVLRCCLHAAHYASVMTENVCESHAPLQRKVTLIKLHLMIELIKSATLFFPVSACALVWL